MLEPFTMTGIPAVDARIADGTSSPTSAANGKALTARVPGDVFWKNFKGSLDIAGATNQKTSGQTSPSGGASHTGTPRGLETNSKAQTNLEFAAGASTLSLPPNPQLAKPKSVSVHLDSSNSEANASQVTEPPSEVEMSQLQGGQISDSDGAQNESVARPPDDDRAPVIPRTFFDRLDVPALVTSRKAQGASELIMPSAVSRSSKTQEPHNVSNRETAFRSIQNPIAPQASSWVFPSVAAPNAEAIYTSPARTNPMNISTLAVNQKTIPPAAINPLEQASVVSASSNDDSDQELDRGSLAADFLASKESPAANDPPKFFSAKATRPDTASIMTGTSDPIRFQVRDDDQSAVPGNLLTDITSVNSFTVASLRQATDGVSQLATVPIDPLSLESAAANSAISLHSRKQLTPPTLQVLSPNIENMGISKGIVNSRSNRSSQSTENYAARDLSLGESTALDEPDDRNLLRVHEDLSPRVMESQASPSQLDPTSTRIRSQEDSGQSKLHEGQDPEATRLITDKESVRSPTPASLTTNLTTGETQETRPIQPSLVPSASPSAVAAGDVPAMEAIHPVILAIVQPTEALLQSGLQHAGLTAPAQNDFSPTARGTAAIGRPDKQLEIGMENGINGWLKVRAEFDDAGRVSASLIAASGNAVEALHRDLPALSAYLKDQSVQVSSLTVHRADSGALVSEPQPNGMADGLGRSGEREGQQRQSEKFPRGEVDRARRTETSLGSFLQSQRSEGSLPRNSGLISLLA